MPVSGVLTGKRMRYSRVLPLLAALLVAGGALAENSPDPDGGNAADPVNVNSRYTVESIDVAGQHDYTLSKPILDRLHGMVGSLLDFEALRSLAGTITRELHAREVTVRVMRGSEPEYVRVVLDVNDGRSRFDVSVPKFLWNSREGWTAEGQATATQGDTAVSVGLLSNGDDLLERYAGFNASLQRRSLGSEKVRFALVFEDYHEEWNRATVAAAGPELLYRSRRNIAPEVTFVLSRGITWSAGFSSQAMQPETGGGERYANAVTSTVRYHRSIEGSALAQTVEASYNLRAAERGLGSDYAYRRHHLKARYTATHSRQGVEVSLEAGAIQGVAPMFERFAPGNSATLRGFDKFSLDPLGGNRVIDGSLAYRYRAMRVFYDAGSAWNRGRRAEPEQSLGVGLQGNLGFLGNNEFVLALAFPLNQGRPEPIFVAGMNF